MSELEKMLQREVLPLDTDVPTAPEQQKNVSEAQALFQNMVDEIATGKVTLPDDEKKLH